MTYKPLAQTARDVVEQKLEEAVDKSSPVYKEYLSLKKKSIKDLRRMVDQQHRGPVDLSQYDKQGAISDLLRNKFGNKAVAAAMGLDESIDIEEEHLEEAPLVTDFDKSIDYMIKLMKRDIMKDRNNEKGMMKLSQLAKMVGLEVTDKGQEKGRIFMYDLAKRKV